MWGGCGQVGELINTTALSLRSRKSGGATTEILSSSAPTDSELRLTRTPSTKHHGPASANRLRLRGLPLTLSAETASLRTDHLCHSNNLLSAWRDCCARSATPSPSYYKRIEGHRLTSHPPGRWGLTVWRLRFSPCWFQANIKASLLWPNVCAGVLKTTIDTHARQSPSRGRTSAALALSPFRFTEAHICHFPWTR